VTQTLDLWPIGNCQVSALIDTAGRFVWGCVPRVDGDPVFSSLIGGGARPTGFWAIDLEGCIETTQEYVRNTPILITRHRDEHGGEIEITDFCPYFRRLGRSYRPGAFAQIVRPVSGSPGSPYACARPAIGAARHRPALAGPTISAIPPKRRRCASARPRRSVWWPRIDVPP
jgi:hypothetical protein